MAAASPQTSWRTTAIHIVFPVLLSFSLFVGSIVFLTLPLVERFLIQSARQSSQDLVAVAWSLLNEYEGRVQKGEIPREEAQARAKERIRSLLYGLSSDNYFWIQDMHPHVLMHPMHPELENQDVSLMEDAHGKRLFVEMVKAAQENGDGFVEYLWPSRAHDARWEPKLSYIRAFEPWGWIVGTGIYLDDAMAHIREVKRRLAWSFAGVFTLLAGLSAYTIWRGSRAERSSLEAQRALRENEQKLQGILRSVVDHMVMIDRDLTVVWANEIAERTLGPGLVGHKCYQAYHGRDHKCDHCIVEATFRDGDPHEQEVDLLIAPPGTQRFWCTSNVAAQDENERPTMVVVISRDITERAQIARERRRLTTAIEQAVEVIVVADRDWRIQYANAALETVSGFVPREVLNTPLLTLLSSQIPRRTVVEIMHAIKEGTSWKGRLLGRKRDGTTYLGEGTVSPVRDPSGELVSLVLVGRDITREEALETQLRQAQKMEVIGTLAGGIAHDFNSLLSAILGYTDLALEDVSEDSQTHACLREVMAAGAHAVELVEQILAFSRQSEPVQRLVYLQTTLREALKLLRWLSPPGVEIRCELSAECGPIWVNPTHMHQVVMNLCTNSFHAMQENGGVLLVRLDEVGMDEPTVEDLPDTETGRYARLTVQDSGEGMDEATCRRAFEPYFTTKGVGRGTGMGLATVRSIVEACAGTIRVESQPARGSRFQIFLPVTDRVTEPTELPTEEQTLNPEGRESVLLVDDEEAILNQARRGLERYGYHVKACTTSAEALIVFKATPQEFDVVVTDMIMPGLTGVELIQRIQDIRQGTPAILCTGAYFDADVQHAQSIGIQEWARKPISHRKLALAIRRAVEAGSTKEE